MLLSTFNRIRKPFIVYRFEQIVHRMHIECFNRVLIESCDKYDQRHIVLLQIANNVKSAHAGHLYIQKHDIGF